MDKPTKRFLVVTLLLTAAYLAVTGVMLLGVFLGPRYGILHPLTGPVRWAMSACFGMFMVGQLWATLVLMRDSDEFVRGVLARQFILASGLAIASYSAWGFAEVFAGAQHIPGFMVYFLFWLFLGAVRPFVRNTR
jgi:putative oxidoreductase